ncbi:Z1 domain-containing protein [Sphingomonas sp. OK281]|uniref:Z1 domain-containing protein n=1 Tax=Sphingomonas sp. OK281 TaxID=1881067 RepID=UPI0015871ABE|nr:Z1 domain-containing protein [Sphingomonas sp. OK281]
MSEGLSSKIRGQVMGFLEEIRKTEAITADRIAQILDGVCLMFPSLPADFDRQAMLDSIAGKISIWIGEERELVNDEGHVEWLAARKPDISWSYWDRYRTLMLPQIGLDPITRLDGITDRILSHLEDPTREGSWDRRGLVVGHVQSGKTANYTGLITKAADAGYKIIIVLAGIHKNLRSQTQIRIEEGFLGYDNDRTDGEGFRAVGVGLIDPDHRLRPDCVTNRADDGDFNTVRAQTFSINPGGRPLVFVIKKQRTVLMNLINWVKWAHTAVDKDTGCEFVMGIPLLVIDDEADHASVDTSEGAFYEDGSPDPEHNPSTINKLIRQLLTLFEQKAYVGYTATPFANIFIHEKAETKQEGPDLFPSSFILSLPAPSDYFGPVHVFGSEVDDDASVETSEHRYVREIDDHADSLELEERLGWVPPKHRNGHVPRYMGELAPPPSLQTAIQSFILATAVRRARGQVNDHNTMLVHVSRFTSVQNLVKDQIEAEVHAIQREFRYGEMEDERSVRQELASLFSKDFEPGLNPAYVPDGVTLNWKSIEKQVEIVVKQLEVREINGSAGDILDQEKAGSEHVATIAVGGDKLSRGLTLKGLTTSYFLRASRMYDTLMQMGRWFGYRRGYEDVCRLFMTSDIREWFEKITTASEELRSEFDHMAAVGGTPRKYGLRVRSHPALLITSRVKMRSGTAMKLSFAGTISETITFQTSERVIENNRDAVNALLRAAGVPTEADPKRQRPDGVEQHWSGSYFWRDVGAGSILSFLASYSTHEDSVKANSNFLRQYIEKQVAKGDLEHWDIALLAGRSSGKAKLGGLDLSMVQRTALERNTTIQEQKDAGKYVIGRLVSPRDEGIDLSETKYAQALDQTRKAWVQDTGRKRKRNEIPDEPDGIAMRDVRAQGRGLLLLYPLDPNNGVTDGGSIPIMAMAISFPTSSNATAIDYVVNNVFARSESEL